MEDNINWKSYYQQEPIEPDIYFKFVCFYQAMTELYDRRLTNERSCYDKTEACFLNMPRFVKRESDWYAQRLYDCVRKYIWKKTKVPFNIERWHKERRKQYSAQDWIDLLEHFRKEKDEIILDMLENIWEYGRIRGDYEQKEQVIIKKPF